MKFLKSIIIIFYLICLCTGLWAQNGEIKYFSQYYGYGINNMSGIRQTLSYAYAIGKRLSVETQVFAGSGRGKDISHNFQRDFVLISKNNYDNVPEFLFPAYSINDGIHSYQRISNGLRQDFGWGVSLNYLTYQKGPFSIDFSIGYIVYQTKAIVRDNIIELKITSPIYPEIISDYRIDYPATIYMNYRDGAVFARSCFNYRIKDRLSLSLNANVNQSLWGSGLDIGGGIGLSYKLNRQNHE